MEPRSAARGLLAAGAAAALACAEAPTPNLILVSIDTLRADAVGAYGGPVPTPALDRLAREGVLLEQAVAPAPATAPSHATLFTGRDVLHHGVVRNGVALPGEAETLAEVLADAGYTTAGFVSSFILDARFGWPQGFAVYDAEFPRARETFHNRDGFWGEHDFDGFDRRAPDTNLRALGWVAAAQEPFFLFVHFFDPHAPYLGPEKLLRKVPADHARRLAAERIAAARRTHPMLETEELARLIRNYHAEVLAVDRAISRLLMVLDARGLSERTLVVVTADHGEGLGQRGPLGHSYQVYEEQVRVPLVFRWPGVLPSGVRLQGPVGLVDVAPTVADLLGVRFRSALDGRSIAGALRRGDEPEPRTLIGRRRRYDRPSLGGMGAVYFVRTPKWKYLRSEHGVEELYDLASDAHELHDLRARHPDEAARLASILTSHLAAHPEPESLAAPSEATRRGLEALGYVE